MLTGTNVLLEPESGGDGNDRRTTFAEVALVLKKTGAGSLEVV